MAAPVVASAGHTTGYSVATDLYEAVVPASISAGDLILAQIVANTSATDSVTPPSGWVNLLNSGTDALLVSGSDGYAWYWHLVTAGEAASPPANWPFTLGSPRTGNIITVQVTGHDTTSPFDTAVSHVAGSFSTTTPLTVPAVTTSVADCLLVGGCNVQSASSRTITIPTGWTQDDTTCTLNIGRGQTAAHLTLGAAGSTGDQDWYESDTSLPGAAFMVAVAPAGSAPPVTPPASTDVFPLGELDARVELDLDGSGDFSTDVTPYVKLANGVVITRGLQSEGSTAAPAKLEFTLLNDDARFSRRNPTGPYYGQLTTNTLARVSIPHIVTRLGVPTGVPSALSTPDTAALSITGDIDVRIDLQADDWQGGGVGGTIIHKWTTTSNQRSWALYIGSDGLPIWFWSADGSTTSSATGTAMIPRGPKRQVIRVTHDVNNGSSGNDVTFYVADADNIDNGPWTQIGDAVVGAGTTSIYNSTASVAIGDTSSGGGRVAFRAFASRIISGIGGTARSTLDLTALTDGATTVDDTEGNTWTPAVGAELQTRDIRGIGAVAAWPMEHGLTDEDCEVQASAHDVLRRLGRSRSLLRSAYTRACTSTVAPVTGLVAYWPCEDAEGSSSLASGRSGGWPMTISGTPVLASDSASFACSSPLPDLGSAALSGAVPNYSSTGQIQVRMLLAVPAAGTTNGAVLVSLRCAGTAVRWEIVYNTGGTLSLNAYSSTGSSLLAGGPYGFAVNGVPLRLDLELSQSGSDVNYTCSTLPVGSASGAYASGTLSSQTITTAHTVVVAPEKNLSGVTAGQVTVQSATTSVYDLSSQLNAYSGETALARIARLCAEESVAFVGHGVDGPLMGYQRSGKLLDLLREAETADAGVLFSPRDQLGLAYRSTDSMSARDAAVSIGYAAGGICDLTPVDDDQGTVNDVEMTRVGGSTYRLALESGPLSVLDPPDGVGLYEGGGGGQVSLIADSTLPYRVGWELHLGTVDEPRVPSMTIDLGAGPYLDGSDASLALAGAVRDLDIGDRVVVSDAPDWSGPDDVDQIVIGLREEICPWEHRISPICRPASPYRVAVYDDTDSRYSGEGTALAEDLDTTETGIDITAPAGVEWTHVDGDYDVLTGGERMTVTGISGSAPSYTLTVTRSVNGVIKTHSSGSDIDLAAPVYYGL